MVKDTVASFKKREGLYTPIHLYTLNTMIIILILI